ncbi:Ti-type conjugative transfer system protein TraG [Chelatococcus asaccharovorans]|uniref:Ti-type conjugative transfer system protein TraG n=1 Tax=Chelatococcus asaccharovorans TaxID=28210 RepID=UPI00224C7183|nr:Ti-type conjugative transfer system protein TraG [Chelatococcus asaccharovorans]CAH1658408.1 Type IV secretion system-coupling protein VirD4 [Chelatococcus asaccharovorans]CAH1688662.1 Type IV secretion system-coupling protein VirD4 [Chelatococcus asaccharovorans]
MIPLLATAVALALTATSAWPHLAMSLAVPHRYWFLRATPIVDCVAGPISGLVAVLMLPLHRRRPVALMALLILVAVAAGYGLREFARLSPFVLDHGLSLTSALAALDAFAIVGNGLGLVIAACAVRQSSTLPAPIKRADKTPFGDADWMTMGEAARLFPTDGPVVIGERYRVDQTTVRASAFDPADRATWGLGGRAPLLTFRLDRDSTHTLFFAGSGGFKTTSTIIPTALRYPGPLVCLDPSTEVAPMVIAHRRAVLGRDCHVLDPDHPISGFNVLDWIATASMPEAAIVAVARMLLSDSPRQESATNSFFQTQAHNLLTGLLAHVMLDPDYAGRRNLRSLRLIVSKPEPETLTLLREICRASSSPFIRETLGVFTHMAEQTFSGIYSTVAKDTQWLSLDAYAALVCGDSFKSRDLVTGAIDVFLALPAATLRSYPGIGRVIIGALMSAMTEANGAFTDRVLFMLDEADLLGPMNVLEEARDRGRKYGITLMLMYQALGQLEHHFGRAGAQAWIDGCAFASYAAIKALDTARSLSAQCGEMTVEVTGRSRPVGWASGGRSGPSETVSHQRRPLILPHEIIQSLRKDEQIIIVPGHRPLRCGRAIFFRRKDMRTYAKSNRFAR